MKGAVGNEEVLENIPLGWAGGAGATLPPF
jgi:hypothetical protein